MVCTGKTLALEIFPKEARAHTAPPGFIAWAIGLMMLALYGFIFRETDWRYLQLALAAFSLYALVEWWYVFLLSPLLRTKRKEFVTITI